MNERADAESVRRAATDELALEDEQRHEAARFTPREWQRLIFLRWLYREGRLTEWP